MSVTKFCRSWASAAATAVALYGGTASATDYTPDFHAPYNVRPSAIVPVWSGATAGEWTFDYKTALEKAKAEGKYTLVLFAGLWWCPHCQALEQNALATEGFSQYVQEQGYYLAALDFPYRNGTSMWCWLWDPAYLATTGLSPEEAAEEIADRFEFQRDWRTPGSATTTNNNIVVSIVGDVTNMTTYAARPTTVYKRVGYPTIVVVDPEGNEAGRFSYNMRADYNVPGKGLEFVIDNIEGLKAAGKSDFFTNPGKGGIDGDAAQTYDAFLTDSEGIVVGSATVKTGKRNNSKNTVKVTASMQVAGKGKKTLSGYASGDEGEIVSLLKAPATAKLTIGEEGVTGVYSDGEANYLLQGSRNVFKAKDEDAKAIAATLAKGVWPVAFKTADNGGNVFAQGTSGLSVSVGSKGKVKVTGVLGDGTKVNLTAQLMFGEKGKAIVPVVAKKGEYSFRLTFSSGALASVDHVSSWKGKKPAAFEALWGAPVFSKSSGAGALPAVMYLQLAGFSAEAAINGDPVAVSPVDDAVVVTGNKWTGTKNVSDLKVTFTPKTGLFKGSFNIYTTRNGKPKKVKVTVNGAVVDGVPYGTAIIKKVQSFPLSFAGSCGGGC